MPPSLAILVSIPKAREREPRKETDIRTKRKQTENLPITYIQKLKQGAGGLGTRKIHLDLHFKLLEMGIQTGLA